MEYSIGAAVLDGWSITRLLGEGSYGKVFEIERTEFAQTYRAALKVITVPQSNAEVRSVIAEGMSAGQAEAYFRGIVEDLVHEFTIMFKLKGTANIVSCEDLRVLEHTDGIGWDILIRMELLHPLLPYVYQHPMARRDIIKLGIDICKALELCQRYNIIHRDIKPENIFISDNGDYKLGDFGIARTIDRTTSGLSKKGTYSYMAPEVYAGKEYGFSVDTYSLGLVLYRMLNKNRGPFLPQPPEAITFSSREQALGKRISGEPLPKPFYGEGRLGEIVLKACAYDPAERYSSPQQFRQELEAIQYAQTDAELIYPSGDELAMDSDPYTSGHREKSRTVPEPKHEDETQGVFGDDFRPADEPEDTDRTRLVFDEGDQEDMNVEPRRSHRGLRIAIGIVGGIVALLALAVAATGFLQKRGAEIPEFLERPIAAVLGKYSIPKALREYEEDGTLEKVYEDGSLSGYQVETYGDDGEHISTELFNTAGNRIQLSIYESDGTVCAYWKYKYDSKGNLIKVEDYDSDGTLVGFTRSEYDSHGNEVKVKFYDPDGTLQEYYQNEYDSNGNCIKREMYDSDGILQYYSQDQYDSSGKLLREENYDSSDVLQSYTLYEYDSNGNCTKVETHNADGTLQSRSEYDSNGNYIRMEWYNEDGELIWYDEVNDAGEWEYYDASGALVG